MVVHDAPVETSHGEIVDSCRKLYASTTRWIAVIDVSEADCNVLSLLVNCPSAQIDEFLVLGKDVQSRNISQFLAEYEAFAGLFVGWRFVGGHPHDKVNELCCVIAILSFILCLLLQPLLYCTPCTACGMFGTCQYLRKCVWAVSFVLSCVCV